MSDERTPLAIESGLLAPPASGLVCWTHPIYDGLNETWRPRTRVLTTYTTIAAFLAAKQAAGWEVELFNETATAPDGRQVPVVAVSLTRTVFGGAPQDDVLHVWVEPMADAAGAGRLEWREAAHDQHPDECWAAVDGRLQAVVVLDEASGQWHVRITDLHDGTPVRAWEAGNTRAEAMRAAERTLLGLNQRETAAPECGTGQR